MNQLEKVFEYHDKQVRTLVIDNEPWFVATDVCAILDINNPTVAVDRLDEDERSKFNLGRQGEAIIVSEPGLYSLILGSRKPEAKAFKRWITHEVIPSIRKHGAYMTPAALEEALLNPDTLIKLLVNLKEEREKRKLAETTLQLQRPKVEFFDAVASSKDAIPIGNAAKVLNIGLGRNTLFEALRQRGVLMKDNIPYQIYIDRGYFRTIEQKYTLPNGETKISIKTLVYQRGLEFIRRILKDNDGASKKEAAKC